MREVPILSICIPTYNRSEHLRKTLDSIIRQKEFATKQVEIVISDNASTDNTEIVAREYCERYSNIFYYKNEKNIIDRNLPLVISRATGIYRKLCNDTMEFNDGAVEMLLSILKNNIDKKPVIFWGSSIETIKRDIVTSTLNDAIDKISYWATSISCFGVWAEDFEYNEDGCDKCLWQVPNLYNAIEKKKETFICAKEFYTIQGVKNKDLSYGLYKVFYTNFLGFVTEKCQNGSVTDKTYSKIKKDLLLKFFLGWVVAKRICNGAKYSEKEEVEELLAESYRREKYYKYYKLKVNYSYFVLKLKKRIKQIINK